MTYSFDIYFCVFSVVIFSLVCYSHCIRLYCPCLTVGFPSIADSGLTCLQVELSRETNNTHRWNITAAYTTLTRAQLGRARWRKKKKKKSKTDWEKTAFVVLTLQQERGSAKVWETNKNEDNFSVIFGFSLHLVCGRVPDQHAHWANFRT